MCAPFHTTISMPCGRTSLYKNLIKEYGKRKGKTVYFKMRKKHAKK